MIHNSSKKNLSRGNSKELVALITGGSRGIGFGVARELAKAGFNLAINGIRDQELAQPIIDILKEYHVDVIYAQGNVSDQTDREIILKKVISHFGHLNVLINNAGVAPKERRDILDATEESFDDIIQTNLKGPYFLTQRVARHFIEMKTKDYGFSCCIINISSVSATVASVNRGEYCISKAGIAMATKLWASRLGEFGIPVYEIQPGVIKTDMTAAVSDKYNTLFEQGLAIQKRWGMPEDVGKVAAAMATGMLPYSTGQVVMVDGGMTIQRL